MIVLKKDPLKKVHVLKQTVKAEVMVVGQPHLNVVLGHVNYHYPYTNIFFL